MAETQKEWPKTLEEAVNQIFLSMYDKDKEIIKNTPNEDLIRFYHGWGIGMRNEFDDHPYTPAKMEPLSVTTIHGHVRTLRAFFTWLVIEGLTQNNVAKDLKPPKISKKVVTTLSDQEIESILNTLSPTEPIREIYKSAVDGRLTVIDKENGGKADSLNAGINYSRSRLFCAIDADDSHLTASEQSM